MNVKGIKTLKKNMATLRVCLNIFYGFCTYD